MQYNPYTDRARTLEDLAAESKAILIRINNPIQMADIPPQQAAAREQLGRWFRLRTASPRDLSMSMEKRQDMGLGVVR